jgi:hypothetical protein
MSSVRIIIDMADILATVFVAFLSPSIQIPREHLEQAMKVTFYVYFLSNLPVSVGNLVQIAYSNKYD